MVPPRRTPSGLGRGLAALIPQRPTTGGALEIPIASVRHNPYQPRQATEQEALKALAASIAEHGVLQPILVLATGDGYQLIAGERRLRAAEMAGLDRVPAVLRTGVEEHDQLELALIENLQRADLNPLEEAHAFRRLIDEFGLTQEDVARRVARARSSVANTLRLLGLAPAARDALAQGRLSEGQARALAAVEDPQAQAELLADVERRHLTVRQVEALAAQHKAVARGRETNGLAPQTIAGSAPPGAAAGPPDEIERDRLEAELRLSLGTKVSIIATRRGGRIVLEYYDADDLGRIVDRLVGGRA